MKLSNLFLLILFLITPVLIFSDESQTQEETKSNEEKEELISLTEERRETLKYGIDSEIITLLKSMTEVKDTTLESVVAEIFSQTKNAEIMSAAVDYFIKIEYSEASEAAEKVILNWEEEEFNTLSAALRYLSNFHNDKTEEIILPIVEHDSKSLASSALSALGKCGTDISADKLLDLLEDDDYFEELKPSIIRALGDMKSEKAIDILIEILEDIDEEKSWRWTACEALGKIAHPDALPAIEEALQDKDTYLRSYAVKALAGYEGKNVEDILIQSLKDSFWRVRVSAAEALGERKSNDAVDILIYKAKKDPENNVKLAAIKALGQISDDDSMDFIRDLYNKNTTPQALRTQAAQIIINDDLADSLEAVNAVIEEEWEKDGSAVLSYTCKYLSQAENSKLEVIFERMLSHKDIAIKIYGIRGIQLNKFKSMKESVEKLTDEKVNNSVRKAALSAIEQL